MPRARSLVALGALALALGCAAPALRYDARTALPGGFDAVVVPGCPNEDDGRLSGCQKRRALWAAVVWERGLARSFIVSGAAAHTPFVEAEALAEAMAALGVPAARIQLEPDALHTDENAWNALRIARALGWSALAVASESGQADGMCQMMADWGQSACVTLPIDVEVLARRLPEAEKALAAVRTARVPAGEWLTIDERERRITARTGRSRPPSFWLYATLGIRRRSGHTWIPNGPDEVALVTWADRLRQRERAGVARAAVNP